MLLLQLKHWGPRYTAGARLASAESVGGPRSEPQQTGHSGGGMLATEHPLSAGKPVYLP